MRVTLVPPVIAVLLVAPACGSDASRVAVDSRRPPAAQPGTASTTTAGSCIEQYSPENLKKRDYAFDGTVEAIAQGDEAEADRVSFEVHKWFKGGSGDKSVRRAYGFAGVTSAGGTPHAIGERLLVAGDEDFAWECGFTRPYDESTAADWKAAFGS